MLLGREEELAQIEAILGGARRGRGEALLLRGDPGIGKTSLLAAAADRANGFTILSVAGLEAEVELPFSAVTDLVEPLQELLPSLPAPQRAAVEGALALGPPSRGDRFAACAGIHGLLCVAAREQPLLVLVDDAHWLDSASAECLGFAGRRLAEQPVAMLAAGRPAEDSRFDATGFRLLEAAPLRVGHSRQLLERRHPDLSAPAIDAVLEAAAGNPLALIELPAGLTPEQRAGEGDPGRVLRPGERLARAFAGRLAPLDESARGALLVAAAAGSRSLAPIVAACRELGLNERSLERAEQAGLVSITAESCEFSHPLLREVAYAQAAAAERRRAHLALAGSVGSEERGWQLAAAAIGPNPDAAAALGESAESALGRGAPIAAADAFERAARLTEAAPERVRWLLAAGRANGAGGRHARAATLIERAVEEAEGELRWEAIETLAMVYLYGARDASEAYRMLEESAGRLEAAEPRRAATALADAAVAAMVAGDCRLALATSERGHALLGEDADATARAQVLSILSWSLTLRGRGKQGRELLTEVDRLLPEVDPFSPAAQSIALAINSRIPAEEYERARAECAGIVAGCREAGMIGMLPFPLTVEADACHRLGDWSEAAERAEEAAALSEETGQLGPLSQAHVIRLWLLAGQGDETGAREAAERALEIALPASHGAVEIFVHAGLGYLELGLGRVEQAIAALERVQELAAERGFEEPTLVPWTPDLVEAYVQAGRTNDAKKVTRRLIREARGAGGAFARSLAARAQGLVNADFDPHFRRALDLDDQRPVPFERVRTLLAWGRRLHRARRRVEARERLREALAGFERLGAEPWARRAEAELRAAGALKRDPVGDPDELTAQEVRVATAVARGATNREVASELFLSPKTIDFHLGRVYRKLGINSRTELAVLVADGRLQGAAQATRSARA